MNPESSKRQLVTTAAIIIILVAVVAGIMAFSSRETSDSETASSTTSPTANPSTNSSPAVAGSETNPSSSDDYKDGAYTAVGSYRSPGGDETITISITLKDGLITDTSAQPGSANSTGQRYQGQFVSGYKEMVVGKNINDLSLNKVSGSSLTPQGFNNAVSQIKAQAKS